MKNLLYLIAISAIGAAFSLGGAPPAHAAGCYADPVTVVDWTATVATALNARDQACTEGSVNVFSLQVGTAVHVIAETNGWYRIEANQKRVWVSSDDLTITDKRFGGTVFPSYSMYMSRYAIDVGSAPSSYTPVDPNHTVPPASSPQPASSSNPTSPAASAPAQTYYDPALLGRMSGYILLQVQSHGEAWYVDPQTAKRYYMKDGATAYQMMRSFGLGVTESDYAKIAGGNVSTKKHLSGRIVLRVQAHGEAYYIHPGDLKVYYLQNGDEAYRIMRLYSLGITDADLAKLPMSELQVK